MRRRRSTGVAPAARDVLVVQGDRPSGQGDEPDNRLGERRLARARLSDEPDDTTGGNVEADVVDGDDPPPTLAVVDRHVAQ